MLGLKKLE